MDPIKLNLATYGYVDRRSAFFLIAVVSLIVVLFSWNNITSFFRNHEMIQNAKGRMERKQHELRQQTNTKSAKTGDISQKEQKRFQMRLAMVKKIVVQDIFPWDRFFETFERMVPDGLFLEKVAPSVAFDRMLITGGAVSARKVSFFLKRLEESEIFHNSVLKELTIKPPASSAPRKNQPDDALIRFSIDTDLRMEPFLSGSYSALIAKYLSE